MFLNFSCLTSLTKAKHVTACHSLLRQQAAVARDRLRPRGSERY